MHLNQLHYFIELHRQGNFIKAAGKLGITQPALSLQIKNLEEELDFKLIDRNSRPLRLTPEGEIFYQKALEITRMVDELKTLSGTLQEEVKGTLRIGIIPTLAPYLVPLFINPVSREYPDLYLEITELKTEAIIQRLKNGSLDCGLLSTPLQTKGILFRPLFYERFFLYVSGKHPLAAAAAVDLKTFDPDEIWYLEEGNCFQNQVNSLCNLSEKPRKNQRLTYRSNSLESLRHIVESRKGATFLPELATIDIPSESEELVKPVKGTQPVREISLALSKMHNKERLTEAFVKVVLENIPSRMRIKPESPVVDTLLKVK